MVVEKITKIVKTLMPDELDKVLETEKGDLVSGLKMVFLSAFVPAITTFLLFAVIGILFGVLFGGLGAMSSSTSALAMGGIFGGSYILMGGIFAVGAVIVTPIMFLIGNGIHWILAKVLGGNGEYSDQVFYMAYPSAAINLLTPVLMVLSMIPCLGYAVSLLTGIYPLYLSYKVIKKVHNFDTMKAAIVILVPVAIGVVIVVAIYLLYFASLFMLR